MNIRMLSAQFEVPTLKYLSTLNSGATENLVRFYAETAKVVQTQKLPKEISECPEYAMKTNNSNEISVIQKIETELVKHGTKFICSNVKIV